MTTKRVLIAAALVAVAMVLQVSVFSEFAWRGIVPDLVLLIVVAAGLARGGQFAMVLGFSAGVMLDLTPPADHTAGRWALALLIVGFMAGMVRANSDSLNRTPGPVHVVAIAAGCAFVGTSVFAISGLLLGDSGGGFGAVLETVGISVAWDILLTPLVVPWVMALFRRLEPDRLTVHRRDPA